MLPLFAYSQEIKLNCYVKDKFGNPLPYANIVSITKHTGTITNELGYFSLNVDKYDSLKISHISFKSLSVAVHDLHSGSIILYEYYNPIKEVVVRAGNSIYEKASLGFFNKDHNGEFRLAPGNQIAVFIENPLKKAALIQSVVFKVKKKGDCDSRLRIRLLENYENKKVPGRDLLTTNYIVESKKLHHKNTVDISASHIFLPQNGLFVLIEWMDIEKSCTEGSFPTLEANLSNKENTVWFNYRDKKWDNLSPPLSNGCYMTPNFSLNVLY
jgi:hypothetical protein